MRWTYLRASIVAANCWLDPAQAPASLLDPTQFASLGATFPSLAGVY